MKNIMLKINAKQHRQEEQEDVMELVTDGKYYKKGNSVYLVYEESELSGAEGCITTLVVKDAQVKLRRYGASTQELQFEKGKKFTGLYETPIGFVDMEIVTNNINNTIEEDGSKGRITIDYEISLKGLLEANNHLSIEIMNAKNS